MLYIDIFLVLLISGQARNDLLPSSQQRIQIFQKRIQIFQQRIQISQQRIQISQQRIQIFQQSLQISQQRIHIFQNLQLFCFTWGWVAACSKIQFLSLFYFFLFS